MTAALELSLVGCEQQTELAHGVREQPTRLRTPEAPPRTQLKEGLGRTIAYFEKLLDESTTRELLTKV